MLRAAARLSQLRSISTTKANMGKTKVAIIANTTIRLRKLGQRSQFSPSPGRKHVEAEQISKIVGGNVRKHSDEFEEEVQMWVFQEKVNGRNLTDIINETHENKKYLPGHQLPTNIVANPDLKSTVKGATALIFVTPHQFVEKICEDLKGNLPSSGVKAITLVKGVDVSEKGIKIFADVIEDRLSISCCALSGANIANEVADEKFCETTIGYRQEADGQMFKKLFDTQNFRVQLIEDVEGVSLCGALKNVVAVAAGFVDGLGLGNNTKSAIIRLGLLDMRNFAKEFFPNVKDQTFLEESAGVADVITSCFGGRNRKVAEAFVTKNKPFDVLEKEMLDGQKLQGYLTALELHKFLEPRGRIDAYPLFRVVWAIAYDGYPVAKLTDGL